MLEISRLRNARITTVPKITLLAPPIQDALREVMAGQFVGPKDELAVALGKAPGEKPWELDIDRWLQKLVVVQSILHKDKDYGKFYRRYFMDRKFSESTIIVAIRLVPAMIAANVVAVNERTGSPPLVA